MYQKDLKLAKNEKLPLFDLPVDFLVSDDITSSLLNFYGKFPCKIDAFILAFCNKGHIKATVNLWNYEIKENDFIVLVPGSFIQINTVSDDTRMSFVGFSSKFLASMNFWKSISDIMLAIFKKPVLSMDVNLAEIYADTFATLTKASLLKSSIISVNIIKDVLNLYIDSVTEALKMNLAVQNNISSSREQDIVAEFLHLAFENYRDEHRISFYAREINLTLSHFCSVISKTAGMTPQEIIMNLIIMDAKTQLKGTKSTVSKIATSLGFVTPTTFNRYFRTYTGMTPLEYRTSN